MSFDFRASQIRTSKIIASSSAGSSSSILVYGIENDGIPPNQGNIANSFDTGSIGNDTFFYVSGSETRRTVFGGGLTLSGTINPLQGLPIGTIGISSYGDGLFETWTGTTTVSTAIYEINNILKAIAPARPPSLSSISSLTVGVTAKLVVDETYPKEGYTAIPGRTVDSTYAATGSILAVYPSGSNFSGILANNVLAQLVPSYRDHGINQGTAGELRLLLNGTVVRTVDLSTELGAVTDVGTGFGLSEPLSVVFPLSGVPFDGFKYRTGSWAVGSDQQTLGYNTLQAVHYVDGSHIYSSNQLEWFIDGGGTNPAYTNEQVTNLSLTGLKYLSGVAYYTGGSFHYSITGSNVYAGSVYSVNPQTYSATYGLQLISSDPLPACAGDNTLAINRLKTVLFQTSGIRLVSGTVTVRTTIPTVFAGSFTSTGASIANILLDNTVETATDTNETFTSETYRLPSNSDFNSPALTTTSWDSSTSIALSSLVGYNDGLQVAEGKLKVGGYNYSALSNGPAGNVDYSSGMGTGDRTYYRMFVGVSASSNFVLRLNGSGATIIQPVSTFTSATQMKVEFVAPSQTGWLSAYDDFIGGNYGDGSGGRAASFGIGRALNTDWGLTIGNKNTANSNDRIYLKITVPYNFTGYLTSISLTFL
jgi:hypothetical protein